MPLGRRLTHVPRSPARQLLTPPHRPPRARVHVARRATALVPHGTTVPDEAGQRQPGLASGLDGERRRRADRDDGREAGRPGLLHDLEPGPAADVQPEVGGRERVRRAAADRPPCPRRCAARCPPGRRAAGPTRSKAAAAWTAPVASNRSCVGPHPLGHRGQHLHGPGRVRRAIVPMRARRSSIEVDPHNPHADVVVATAGLGHGRDATGVDAHDVEVAVDRAAGAAVPAGEHGRAGEQPVAVAQPDGQLEVVAGRAHRRGDEVVVEPDLERLLHDELVGTTAEDGSVPALREHLRGAAPDHPRRVSTHPP